MELAFSYIHLGEAAKAEPLLRESIAAFSQTGGPENPEALRVRVYLSQALLAQQKYAEAIKEANLIYPAIVKKLGEDHEVTMSVLGTRAASEGNLGMWDEAIRDDLNFHEIAVRKQGPTGWMSIGALSDAAPSQCHAGRYREGEANARRAFEQSRQVFGPHAGITGGTSYSLAICLMGLNQLQDASDLLQNIDAKAVTQLSADATVSAAIALAQGEIAARRGDYTLAQKDAETATPAFDRPNAPVSQRESLQELRKEIDSHLLAPR